jgi:glycosyltransferase involved in cell wall biosynthesis
MGRGHRFGEFLAAAESLRDDAGVRWVFAGDGPRRSELDLMLESCGFRYVESKPYVPHDRLREHLLEGDVHLISLDPSWDGCMVPSKLMAVFAVGRPVIFVGGSGNSAAKWIRESGGGWVVPPNDVDTLLAVIREARSAEERGRRGHAALNYARKHFSPREACGMICGRLEAIA